MLMICKGVEIMWILNLVENLLKKHTTEYR